MKKSKTILFVVALFAVSGIVTGFTLSTNTDHKTESQSSLKSGKANQSTSKLGRTELDERQF